MKVLVIGDPHFKTSNVKETDEMTESILKIAKENSPTFIVILGDVLDRHELIHVSPLVRANKFIFNLSEVAKTYLLIGNHDLKNNRQFLSEEHPFYSMKNMKNIVIVDKTICEEINGNIFTMVPYVPPGMFMKALELQENWTKSCLIFAHQEFKGCRMGALVSEEGDEWNIKYPPVISGHIHNYQELNNIIYVGTPIQHGYDDSIDKTISLLNFDGDKFNQKRLSLECRKKKIVRITTAEVMTYQPEENCDLRICITGTPGEIKGIIKHPSISKWKSKGINIKYKDIAIGGVKQKSENTREILPYLEMIKSGIKDNLCAMEWYNQLIASNS